MQADAQPIWRGILDTIYLVSAQCPGPQPPPAMRRYPLLSGRPSRAAQGTRPYFRIAAISRSRGSACTRRSSAPVIVSAASMEFTIAASVACTVA